MAVGAVLRGAGCFGTRCFCQRCALTARSSATLFAGSYAPRAARLTANVRAHSPVTDEPSNRRAKDSSIRRTRPRPALGTDVGSWVSGREVLPESACFRRYCAVPSLASKAGRSTMAVVEVSQGGRVLRSQVPFSMARSNTALVTDACAAALLRRAFYSAAQRER
jgi:hypothetical protein